MVRINRAGLAGFIFLFSVLTWAFCADAGVLNELVSPPAAEGTPAPAAAEKPAEPKPTIPLLISYTTELSKKLIELESRLADIGPVDREQDKIKSIEKTLHNLQWKAKMQQADTNLNYIQLTKTLQVLSQLQLNLDLIDKPLHSSAQYYDDQKKYWTEQLEILEKRTKQLKKDKAFPLVRGEVSQLEKSIKKTLATIDARMKATLATIKSTADLQVRLYRLKITLDDQLSELKRGGLEQTSPPLYSSQFLSRLHLDLLQVTWHNAISKLGSAYRSLTAHLGPLLLILLLPTLLSTIFIINRERLANNKHLSMLVECPISFSVFTVLIFVLPMAETSMGQALPLIALGLILSVMRLAGRVESGSIWMVRFIYALGIFLAISLLKDIVDIPLPLERLFITVSCCLWLAYYLWRCRALRREKDKKYLRMALRFICLILTGIIIASVLGYDRLARFVFKGTFTTIFLFISSVILFNTLRILMELVLSLLPVINRHTSIIISSLQPFIFVLCVLLFYASTASVWLIFPTSQDAVTALMSFGYTLGEVTLTMKDLLLGLGIIYGAFLVSRAIQAILLGEIMPRNNIDRGVQLSIARLVHYTVITIGLIILLQVMGVSLTKLTILGGALSVGIGFGLQTIVNNFASGLILLFERPIKVGDTIEIGTELGEVRHLGLRSTIIKTFDNAEIVVPNSDLISGQVTNWTLSERGARVKLPIGVAYGTDIETVLEILLRVAKEHPVTMTTPAPRALFLAFGDSSLDFELRVWVADFSDRRLVQSELNQQINSEFADASIEIPFPQTDLHLRSVDEEAAKALGSGRPARVKKRKQKDGEEWGNPVEDSTGDAAPA